MSIAKLINRHPTQTRRASLPLRTTALSAALLLMLTACGGSTDSAGDPAEDASEASVDVELSEFITHSGPGGGSDVFVREVSALLQETGLVDSNVPVKNVEGGASARALGAMAAMAGSTDTLAAMTPTWLTTPLTTTALPVTVEDLTPIAQLITEPTVMAVRADSEYQSLQDFIDAAHAAPGDLIQVGGSVTAIDAMCGAILQEATGAEWEYLSFAGGGERIASLLGGDSDMMFGSPSDFAQQAEAGALRVIAVIGDDSTELFPEVPTLEEAGFTDVNVPQQFRGIVGPPDMPEEAAAAYAEMFKQLTETEEWAAYMEELGSNTVFKATDEFDAFLSEQIETITTRLDGLGLLVDQG